MSFTRITAGRTQMARHSSDEGIGPIAEQSKSHCSWNVYPSWQYDLLVQTYGTQHVKLLYMVRHAEGTHNISGDYNSIEQLDARLTQLGKSQCQALRDEILLVKKDGRENISNGDDVFRGNRITRTRNRHGLEYLIEGFESMKSDGEGNDKDNGDICVVMSPLTRCIQTALLSLDFLIPSATPGKQNGSDKIGIRVPFLAFEALRETVNYHADRRRRISEVAKEFPQVDFSYCPNNDDEIWMSYRNRENEETKRVPDNKFYPRNKTILNEKNFVESAELFAVADRGRQALEFLQSLPQTKIVVCTHSAYLRCILNWGQKGGVPDMFDQSLDDREDPKRQDKLFNYCYKDNDSSDKHESERYRASFEKYMREDYKNAEIRSFCLLVQE